MASVKKGIALIMLTLVMLIGSLTQPLTASADTISGYALEWTEFKTKPNTIYTWSVKNSQRDTIYGYVNFGYNEPVKIGGNNTYTGVNLAVGSTGYLYLTKDFSFTFNPLTPIPPIPPIPSHVHD